jgi:polyphosphate kinase
MDALRLDPPRAPVPARTLPFAVPRSIRPVQTELGLTDPALYLNRELSWVDFNWRVLHQAMDERVPLLERVRFLSIAQSNLDEFFRTRVGGLKRQLEAGVTLLPPDGRSTSEQLHLIRDAVAAMQETMDRTWLEQLHPALNGQGIAVREDDSLGEAERRRMALHVRRSIYPVLTPLAVDPGHPFPFISDSSLSLAVVLFHPVRPGRQFARLKIPTGRGRWIALDEPGHFLPLEALVARHMEELFPGTEVDGVHAFRVARNADLWREEDEAEDLLEMISEELRERRFAPAIRLEVNEAMSASVVDLLCSELDLDPALDVYRVKGLVDYGDLRTIADLDRPALRFPPWEPVPPPVFRPAAGGDAPSVFATVRAADRLVHHPYDSFSASVQRFLDEAADDRRVLAIKMTLYRTSENSPIVRALVRAADRGKQVAVLVEVTARFDELKNIEWGQTLERAGVHVTYGLVGLKTHAKVTLVVREDEDGIRTYCHLGTGNYNVATARLYTDLGLFTADTEIGEDVVRLFHYLTGHAPEQRYTSLLISPRDLRGRFEELVAREVEHARAGRSARIVLKMNALDDAGMIQGLYGASQAGVRVDLIVRGHTRLRPGVPGVSDRIRLRSIVGRFLEHDRIFWFENGGEPDVLIGSSDWRRRNLEERVEAVVRIQDPELKSRLRRILDQELLPDGAYRLCEPAEGEPARSYHDTLMHEAIGPDRTAPSSAAEQNIQIA